MDLFSVFVGVVITCLIILIMSMVRDAKAIKREQRIKAEERLLKMESDINSLMMKCNTINRTIIKHNELEKAYIEHVKYHKNYTRGIVEDKIDVE